MTKLSGVIGFVGFCAGVMACREREPSPQTSTATLSTSTPPSTAPAPGTQPSLTIWWAQWAPADGLQELAREFGRIEKLIASTVQRIGEALDGQKSSREALGQLAAEHEKILQAAD